DPVSPAKLNVLAAPVTSTSLWAVGVPSTRRVDPVVASAVRDTFPPTVSTPRGSPPLSVPPELTVIGPATAPVPCNVPPDATVRLAAARVPLTATVPAETARLPVYAGEFPVRASRPALTLLTVMYVPGSEVRGPDKLTDSPGPTSMAAGDGLVETVLPDSRN